MREQGNFRFIADKLVRYTLDTYPAILKVLRRDAAGGAANFNGVLRARYGSRAESLIRYFARHKVRLLSQAGMLAIRHGNYRDARRCFARAILWDPARAKTYLRYGRTFLPAGVASRLSGKSQRPIRH